MTAAPIGALTAQTTPPPPQVPQPGRDLPGQLTPREVVTPPRPTEAPAATASVDARGALPRADCPFDDSPIRLTLSQLRFTRPDGTALQPEIARTLTGIVAPAGEQPIRVVCDLRDRANAALRRDGWIATVQIPAQSIDTGTLTLQVVTARITEVRVRGTPGPFRRTIEERVKRLRALDPLNERDAERALLLAGDVPGLDVQLSLRPAGTQPGDVIGDLSIAYRPFAVFANVQNYNSRALGRETGYVRGEIYGLTGLQDLTYVGLSSTADFREQRIAQAGHIFGLNNQGTTLGTNVTYAWSRPDLGALDLRTDTLISTLDLVTPLIRRVNSNLRIGTGFEYINQLTDVAAGSTRARLNEDRLRIGYLRLSGDMAGRRPDGTSSFQVRAGVDIRKGLDVFGSTPVGTFRPGRALPSRIEGNSRAFVVRTELDTILALGRIFSFRGQARAQWADKPLLNYEEFSLGNLTLGRGYDPGANSGDRAAGFRGELRAVVPVSTRVVPEAFGFLDHVYLTNLDSSSTETNRRLRSYGGGLRLTLPDVAVIEATYAHPRDRALRIDSGPPGDRVLLSLTLQYRARAR